VRAALALTLSLAAVSAAAAPRPIGLEEAYAAALKRSEAVAEKGESYAQALAQIDELWAAVKPHLSLNATQIWQAPAPAAYSAFSPTSQPTVALNVTQPVFSGFREYLAVRESQATGESAELQLERAKQLLYQDVTTAYLNLLQVHQDIAAREQTVKLTEDRVKELTSFERIGRSRQGEVLAAKAQLAQNVADVETSRGAERSYQATLQFLTGLDDELAPQDVLTPVDVSEEAPFLERARKRPDVESARRDLEASQLNVSIESRQRWPTITFAGNYYLVRPENI
jgi:outer membrane protein TolC